MERAVASRSPALVFSVAGAMRRPDPWGISIAEASRQTGIPTTTLRFFEKELPGLLPINKTRGGHRRYRPEDIAKVALVRRLTSQEGVTLSQVRSILTSRGDSEPLRQEMERLAREMASQADAIQDLSDRVARLEAAAPRGSRPAENRRRGWFRKR